MKNKNVGLLIIGIAIILGIIVFLFNNALKNITSSSCSMGTTCPMYGTINVQTYVAGALIAIIVIIGVILMLSKEEKQIIMKTIREKIEKKGISIAGLNAEEKKLIRIISEAKGSIFQSELTEKSGFDKVKVTRVLDRLEGQGFIERRRRGMTNIVLLKQ
jgi:hypothetical protein